MRRLLFEKKGDAVWISHLDLMRLFQRAFKRAGLKLKHTQGFNPRPSVSIALPLSVGVESQCELLDFDLEGESVPFDEIRERLNQVLIPGVSVKSVYEDGKKIRDIAFMQSQILLYYHTPVTDGGSGIEEICRRESLPALKKSKNGQQEVDIAPMIRSVSVEPVDGNTAVSYTHLRAHET